VRRTLTLALIILTALLLQSTVFSGVRLVGVRPELIYLVTILIAMLEGPRAGAVAGFAGGMAHDILLNHPGKGATALTLTLLGYAIGMFRQYIVTPSPWLPAMLVAGGTAAGIFFYGIITFLIGQLDAGWAYLVKAALLSGLYNAVLTPVIYPVIRRVTQSSHRSKVFR
jgi:rod shape-determining protein MreD